LFFFDSSSFLSVSNSTCTPRDANFDWCFSNDFWSYGETMRVFLLRFWGFFMGKENHQGKVKRMGFFELHIYFVGISSKCAQQFHDHES
jgi:hypothetical protein